MNEQGKQENNSNRNDSRPKTSKAINGFNKDTGKYTSMFLNFSAPSQAPNAKTTRPPPAQMTLAKNTPSGQSKNTRKKRNVLETNVINSPNIIESIKAGDNQDIYKNFNNK